MIDEEKETHDRLYLEELFAEWKMCIQLGRKGNKGVSETLRWISKMSDSADTLSYSLPSDRE